MKLLHLTFHFEFADRIEAILEHNGVESFVRYPMMQGKDVGGEKHYNTQVHPGALTIIHAQIEDGKVAPLFKELKEFRDAREAHNHLEAVALAIEQALERKA